MRINFTECNEKTTYKNKATQQYNYECLMHAKQEITLDRLKCC